ncbi:ubiquitin carboxyl-terminal hydrolase, putative [Entamoeba dispar SAW760]|uniref:Ubiquitin carboxyl-terminal hydrolase n=1 Tax=Entamoeba dispar (strain ATCC PRA-260 / SAW760) TaxID=370354 RepID=B0EKK3_ENTDS|nr:ubiquitin carboxyl-terminal hydrolase, putative [Entamoeba dispar SAW760]EDR24940.1 ubiquitin carboxyl-terminal hydrolase, putative [Entamoeba dispar SAW760]|eukprot:EDR24940.1 ubiquitin carboxyl-terminal hydrolase, putative [Entamoeba dispar SAW760]
MVEECWNKITTTAEIFQEYCSEIGVDGIHFEDVYSLEEQLDKGTKGFIVSLPYPIQNTDFYENNYQTEHHPFFIHQTIGNICPLMAIIHILINSPSVQYQSDGTYGRFIRSLQQTQTKEEITQCFQIFKQIHFQISKRCCTKEDEERENIQEVYHCIAIIPFGSHIFVLDGRKGSYCVLSLTSRSSFVSQALSFICNNAPSNGLFSVVSLC